MSAQEMVRPRPLRRRLGEEVLNVIAEQRSRGLTPAPVHLLLVDDADERRTALGCGEISRGWGDWITGDSTQVTCRGCLETVHA